MPSPVMGLLLCGGEGRRVGGADKGLMDFAGQTLASAVARPLASVAGEVLVSANRHAERYRALGFRSVFGDRRGGFAGPLAGLEAASALLEQERPRTEIVLVLPCDVPYMDETVLRRLLTTLKAASDCDAVYACTAEREHYLCLAARVACLGSIGPYLDGGGRSVRGWLEGQRSVGVAFADADAEKFRNLNRPGDWRDA